MILSCPSCATQYTLDEAQLGPAGRTVRCAACKATWHAVRPEEPIELPPVEKEPPARTEDLNTVKADKLGKSYRALQDYKKRMKALAAQGLIWGALAACCAAVFVTGYLLRVDIVRTFPRVAGAYAMVGLPVYGTNLRFVDQSASTVVEGGRFVVTVKAQVSNTSDKAEPVPPVRVALLDSTLQPFNTVVMPSNGLVVAPHATRTLSFDVADPKNLTAHLDLRFDMLAMKHMKAVPAGRAVAAAETPKREQVATAGSETDAPADPETAAPAAVPAPLASPALRTAHTSMSTDDVASQNPVPVSNGQS